MSETKRILCVLQGVEVTQDDTGKVTFVADADIDADGANGQNGAVAAYRVDNRGSEHLANGGMKIIGGRVQFAESWGKDIVLVQNGRPLVLPGGIIPSRTAYRFKGKSENDPAAYVDAETIPYAVVSPLIRNRAKGVVLGCRAVMTNIVNGKTVEGVVADIGPRAKIGELSIAAARALGIPSNPRSGGTQDHIVRYELFPGTPARIPTGEGDAVQEFDLIAA